MLRGGNAALVLVCVVFIGEYMYRVLVASRETISISGECAVFCEPGL